MNGEKRLLFVLWMKTLIIIPGALKVRIEPKSVVKHVNESLEIVCRALDCPGEANFVWRALTDDSVGGNMTSNRTTSRRMYSQLTTEDQRVVICLVTCENTRPMEAKTTINVFSFPSDPVLSRVNDSTLMCTVHSVYSSASFRLEWLQGNTVILDEDIFCDKDREQDIWSVYMPNEKDLGKNITCRVTLTQTHVPDNRRVRSVTTQYGPTFMTISNNATVKLGERLELKCDADEKSSISWKKLGKSEATLLTKTRVLVIEKVTWSHAGQYECEARAGLASRRSRVGVTVQGPPSVPKIRLSQEGLPKAGDNVTIFCDSDSVPAGRLRLSGPSLNQVEMQTSVSVNIPSVELKDSGLYLCEVQTDFGSTRSSINITVQAPPRNSKVLVNPSADVMEDQNITISCSTVSFPPASITLRKEQGLESVSPNGIFYLFNLKSEDKGLYTVNFTNEHGYEVQTFELTVKEQSRITPVLPKAVGSAVSSLSLLTAAALILRHLRRNKKGSAELNLGDALAI